MIQRHFRYDLPHYESEIVLLKIPSNVKRELKIIEVVLPPPLRHLYFDQLSVFSFIFLFHMIAAVEYPLLKLLTLHFYMMLKIRLVSVLVRGSHSCRFQWRHSVLYTVSYITCSGGKAPSMSSLPSGTWAFSRSFLGTKSNRLDEAGFGRKLCGREACGFEGFPNSCSGLNVILRTHERDD